MKNYPCKNCEHSDNGLVNSTCDACKSCGAWFKWFAVYWEKLRAKYYKGGGMPHNATND